MFKSIFLIFPYCSLCFAVVSLMWIMLVEVVCFSLMKVI